jgi:Ring hydroxylating alpha subunit (catalytic domain)
MSLYEVKESLVGETRSASYAIDVFPNLTLLAFPDGGVTTMQWLPQTCTRTRIRVQAYSHYGQDDVDPMAVERLVQMIQVEDYAICEAVQKGLQSQFYDPGPLHYLEQRTHRFQKQLMRMMNETPRPITDRERA